MLNLTLPNGTFEPETLRLFEEAGLPVLRQNNRSYKATINDPRIAQVKFLRPQEIPRALQAGHFDIGLCGIHSALESNASLVEVMDLGPGGRAGGSPRVVLAVPADAGIQSVAQLPNGIRVSTEFPNMTEQYFAALGINAQVSFSHGTTEAAIPEMADAIVEITESGFTLQQAGLIILDTLSAGSLKLFANEAAWAEPAKHDAITQISMLLRGTLQARGKVLLRINVSAACLADVMAGLPEVARPYVFPLLGTSLYAVETVLVKASLNLLIPELKRLGAGDIIELPISKLVE